MIDVLAGPIREVSNASMITYLRRKKRCAIALSSCPVRGGEGVIRLLPSGAAGALPKAAAKIMPPGGTIPAVRATTWLRPRSWKVAMQIRSA